MGLLIGAARRDITPRVPCRLAGYAARNKPHEGIHAPLSLRALYARGEDGTQAVLISADLIWFGGIAAPEVRGAVGKELGVPESHVLVAGTHTHSAPDGGNAQYLATVAAQALAAAALAKDRARPGRLSVARGKSGIGVNRRERRRGGKIVLGRNPDGPIDREIVAVAADGMDGRPIARLANFACHGVVLSQENYQVSGDWPGLAAAAIERRMDGAPFLFFNGGCGNVNPRVGPQEEFGPVAAIADEFVGDYLDAAGRFTAVTEEEPAVFGGTGHVEPARKDGSGGGDRVPVHGIRLGGVRLVGFPGEIFSETTMAVKVAHPGKTVMVAGYVNDSESGYVPVREAYAEGGYEVDTSRFDENAEEIVRAGLIGLAGNL